MSVPAVHCEAKLHAFRRTQDGVVVSFVVHPSEVPQCLALDPLGSRYMIALAAIGDDEQPVAAPHASAAGIDRPASPSPPSPRAELGRHRYAQSDAAAKAVTRAALLPKDVRFRKWAARGYDGIAILDHHMAAAFIREKCGVLSRREIGEQPTAYARFLQMEMQYLVDSGQIAETR